MEPLLKSFALTGAALGIAATGGLLGAVAYAFQVAEGSGIRAALLLATNVVVGVYSIVRLAKLRRREIDERGVG